MNKNIIEYLNMVYDIDDKRGKCDNGGHKFTLEEVEKAISLVKDEYQDLTPQFHIDHYHLMKQV